MKKLFFSVAAAAVMLCSCSGTKDYDNYVADLANQPAVIDTISSAQSYAAYIDTLVAKGEAFEALDIKLNPDQEDEISALSLKIQEALEAKYNQLAQTPMILPDSMLVPDGDLPASALDASTPIERQ